MIELIKSKQEKQEDDEEENDRSQHDEEKTQGLRESSTKSKVKCKKCDRKIKEKMHQSNGKHLNRCYDCYLEKKANKKSAKENVKQKEEEKKDENKEEKKLTKKEHQKENFKEMRISRKGTLNKC